MSGLAAFAGRYGAFIWPAYGASLLAFAWMIADTVLRAWRWRREARRLEGAREGSSLDAPGQQAADVSADKPGDPATAPSEGAPDRPPGRGRG